MKIISKKPFIVTLIFLGGIILLASFISIPQSEVKPDELLSGKFNNLFLKDSVVQTIEESSVRRHEIDKAIAQYDHPTDYKPLHVTYAIRELMWEEKEMLKSTLATWQQSKTWETDSATIINNLVKQKALSNQIEKSLAKLN
jgi:hypothetical protein